MDDVISPFHVCYKIFQYLRVRKGIYREGNAKNEGTKNDNKNFSPSSFTFQTISWLSFFARPFHHKTRMVLLFITSNKWNCMRCFVGTIERVKLNVCINFWSIELFFALVYFPSFVEFYEGKTESGESGSLVLVGKGA